MVRLLLDEGADVNMEGGRCAKPLYAAHVHGNHMIVELLLSKGPNYELTNGILRESWIEGNVSEDLFRSQYDWEWYYFRHMKRI